MPEGDTVYATAQRLASALGGAVLRRAELRHPRLATADLTGRVFEGARPVGKHLFLRFGGDISLHCHLGMDGSWRIHTRRPPISHRTRAVLATSDKYALGNLLLEMALVRTPEEHRLVDHLGPDLLDPDWSDEHHARAVRGLTADPERELGDALLDQRLMAGVGNVFKVEMCFLLGVSPWVPVSAVDPDRTVDLARRLLLRNALRPVRNTTGDPRRGRETWVYGRQREGCLRCGGRVRKADQGPRARERITYYCPHCQPGPAPQG
ncbi:DNA-formamidopyrimidine glycosylase family protein [Actinophytocola xanthii]|uniref:DNA-(apurinic or apyrimidinic site) lyase n=1 Tax=Actinophytocola xanthii TaxID=1912961 RepID=A0A1Q8CPL9_9PSEU|nr:DNA-formamidopyrimidine glycosylase family protein [Actinophytocola xanthii]OLF16278.1 DNA glycosylase [Actinophytocola xanthii]